MNTLDNKLQDLHRRVKQLRDDLRSHASEVEDPKCAALCETSGEVLGGIEESFDHFLQRSEKAWE